MKQQCHRRYLIQIVALQLIFYDTGVNVAQFTQRKSDIGGKVCVRVRLQRVGR